MAHIDRDTLALDARLSRAELIRHDPFDHDCTPDIAGPIDLSDIHQEARQIPSGKPLAGSAKLTVEQSIDPYSIGTDRAS